MKFSKNGVIFDKNIIFIKYKKLNILNSKFNIKFYDKTLYKLSIIKQIGFYLIKYNQKKLVKIMIFFIIVHLTKNYHL